MELESRQNASTSLNGCLIVLPYWIVDILKAHNKPASTLKKIDELRSIITGTDLDFYISNRTPLRYSFGGDQHTLEALSDTLNDYRPTMIMSNVSLPYDNAAQDNMMKADAKQYVRPLFDGMLYEEYPYLFDAIVIDDSGADGLGVIFGIVVKSAQAADKAAEMECISNFISLLSKYYGIEQLATTPLMARYIKLKMQSLKK